jgi:hypothetical protein
MKLYNKSLDFLGKHYLIRNSANPRVKRHYTITNCMKKEVYKEYMRIIKEASING